ncbi:efflux RND transporter periplasmic adaptor subunit [Roseibium sp.]|uniref:efflux RND transporter periplasmic adaptor subunit n=1 Tax=Roseibium sp. TaxID=1936156 RepID=UPI003D0AC2BF
MTLGPQTHQTADEGNLSYLEQTLWKALSSETDSKSRLFAMLALMAERIGQVTAAVVVLKEAGQNEFAPVAVWPQGIALPEELTSAAQKSLDGNQGLVLPRSGTPERFAELSCPVTLNGTLAGVIAITVSEADSERLKRAFREVQWAVPWVREALLQAELSLSREQNTRTNTALKLFAATLSERRFRAACLSFVSDLAARFDCERVSLGFSGRRHVKVTVISKTARFSKEMNLVRMIGSAMDEALDQRAMIVYPADPDDAVATRAHQELASAHKARSILTLPLFVADRFIGALTLERSTEDRPFTKSEIETLDYVSTCVAPILQEKRENDRLIIVKLWESLTNLARSIVGPRYFGRKLGLLAALLVVVFLSFARTEYRVTADARLEGTIQRVVAAPFDGFIGKVEVRPGDTVEAGELLVALDDRDLVLERLKWATERDRQKQLYDKALSDRDRTEIKIARTKIDQANAQIKLVDEQLLRARLKAPFAGLVISGDQSQKIGAAVKKGETLMEIAPLDSYRVILGVKETQIDDVAVGQTGNLVVSSLPDTTFPMTVRKITPVAQPVDGGMAFMVEAALEGNQDRLRPGMEGVGKIDVEERPLVWVWIRPVLDWGRLAIWRWIN